MTVTDPGTIIAEVIDRKEGRQVTGKCLPIDKRVRLFELLQAARISIDECNEKNQDLSSTLESLHDLIEDAAGSLLEAAELLEEQAQQLL